ncbi:MAG: hypothetical protein QME52_05140 [Bacteroidota bacterium]|nr:hypothetical protein [Bacteroidota bacterium]
MMPITISKKYIKNDDLVILPRKKYEEYLALVELLKKHRNEEVDTEEAIAIYKKEKRQGKLKVISSLSDLK